MRVEVPSSQSGAWTLSTDTVTSSGALFTGPVDPTKCGPQATGARDQCVEWLKTLNLSQKATYVPGSQFWALQWREFGVLILVTFGLSAFSLWWIRRRLA
jgi:hypothetical protein